MMHADPSLSIAQRVDAACDHFEAEWKAGRRPDIEDYLTAAADTDREILRDALRAVQAELIERGASDTSVSRSSVRSAEKSKSELTDQYTASASPAPTIGRFQIRGTLGAGAFGKVYRAFDPQLGREVAVKVPLATAIQSEADRTRFLKEGRAAATINHPNVCQIHEVGEADGQPYIVMALVPGQSLAETLAARKEPFPQKQSALIIRKLALALSAAHDKGIVHRDLKPANVMFDRERKDIIVMDFGLARGPRLGNARDTQSGVIMGTPAYMSPEQARGDSKLVGPTGDIYSLGVIFYELLAGGRPFTGTATEVIGQILHIEPEPPSKRRPDIDPRLEAVCMKAMAKGATDRFGSMKEFAAALDAIVRTPAASPDTETTQAKKTRVEGEANATSANIAEVFAAMSMERRQTLAETAAAVQAVAHRSKKPFLLVLMGLAGLGILFLCGFIVLYFRSGNTYVQIVLETKIDSKLLEDKTIEFFLDGKALPPGDLKKPIELKEGEHTLTAMRGDAEVARYVINVRPNEAMKGLGFEIAQVPPPGPPPPPLEPKNAPTKDRKKIVWQPLISSAIDLEAANATNHDGGGHIVKYENSTLELKGSNAEYRPNYTGKNYIVRMKIVQMEGYNTICWVRRQPNTFRGYGAYFNNPDPRLQFPPYGLGKQHVGAGWRDIAGTTKRVTHDFPVEFAVAAFDNEITMYVNRQRVIRKIDKDSTEGGISFSVFRDGHVFLRDLEVCTLDDTDLTPEDVIRQEQTVDPDREVAEWVVENQGKVTLQLDTGVNKEASHIGEIPSGRFHVTKVWFWQVKSPTVGEGIHRLAALSRLREVWVPNVQISDAQARSMMGILTLEVLDLRGTRITDDLVPSLARLPKLHGLGLQTAFISDEGMAALADHTQLKGLGLRWSKVTSVGVLRLAKLVNLETLELSYLNIDDRVIDTLLGFKRLRDLNITGTKISPQGIARLREGLPQCKISSQQ